MRFYNQLCFVLIIISLVVSSVAYADVEGQGTGVNIVTEPFEPLMWLCDNRIMLDDNLEWGRYTEEGDELIERKNNYGFEGEQIQWTTLVMDKNGIETIKDVYVELNKGDPDECPDTPGCYGLPAPGSCGNLNLDQCTQLTGCTPICDIFVDSLSMCAALPCYTSIQAAVDAASNGDTICVNSGIYTEQIIINKNLNLIGIGLPQINAPASRSTFTFPESSRTWDPILFAFGGTELAGAVSGTQVIQVLIEGFSLNGVDDFHSGTRYVGILFRNADGTIRNNIVSNMGVDGVETFGIIVHGDSEVIIEHNQVSDYARGGISLNGDLDSSYDIGPYPDPSGTVRYNTVTGPGLGVPVTWAPNGIQYGYGATGSIFANIVTGNGWPGTAWSGSGIIVVDTHDVIIEQNDVFSNEAAINVGEYWNPAADCQIIDNDVHENEWGISVFNDASNTLVQGNNVIDNTYDGIDVYKYGSWLTYPTGTLVNQNNIAGNGGDGFWTNLPDTIEVVDATNNWWGDPSGPSGQGPGTGDTVIGNVSYTPWAQSPFPFALNPVPAQQISVLCGGTPLSCSDITDENKCNQETPGCRWVDPDECRTLIPVECNMISECYGVPAPGSCENYDYEQCISITGCELICDIYVDDVLVCEGDPCYATIQAGVDAASDGDTVCVHSGTYTEQVVINKDLNLVGINLPQVNAPSSRNTYTFPESSRTWDPVLFAFGGTETAGDITGSGVIQVLVEGFVVDGQNDFQSSRRYVGILFRNADGTIRSNIVQNIGIDGQETFGIVVQGDSETLVEHNQVSDYARGGIALNGDLDASSKLGPYPDPIGTVRYNTVIGPGLGADVTWAPNGIQYGYGATGNIFANSVTGNGWPGTEWSGSGIIVVDTNDVVVEQNDVFSNEAAINLGEFWGNQVTDCQIIDNFVHENEWGISVFNDASNTIVQGNNVVNNIYDGIDIYKYDVSWHNYTIYPSGTLVNQNNIAGNGGDGFWTNLPDTIEVVDATNNWWGDPSGPSGQGPGSGDTVIGNASFDPWSQTEFPFSLDTVPPQEDSHICEGTPTSCSAITDEYKCVSETPGCNWMDQSLESCNARIDEEQITEFDSQTMARYWCVFTIEPASSMHGEYWVAARVIDQDDASTLFDEQEYWYFNPVIALTLDNTPLDFGTVRPGTIEYSNTILVGNGAEEGSGVMMDMFISGTDFYDPGNSAARCVLSNQLKLGDNTVSNTNNQARGSSTNRCQIGFTDTADHFCYYAVNGAYGTYDDPRADAEGYAPIVYGNSFSRDFYNDAELIQAGRDSAGMWWHANILNPTSEMSVTFKLGLPEPCVGDFSAGNIYFWGEAI